jgi:cytochrome c553
MRLLGTSAAVALAALSWQAASAADAGRVEMLATTVCHTCHMPDGNSTVPLFPKLAGQQPEYIAKQLADFIAGRRINEAMAPFLPQVKSADIAGLAAYYSAQARKPGTVEDAAIAAAGRKLYDDGNEESGVPACSGCHEAAGEGSDRFPRLAGQHQTYTAQELLRFKNGERTNDKGKVMRAVAERLTEDEIRAVAEYLAGL